MRETVYDFGRPPTPDGYGISRATAAFVLAMVVLLMILDFGVRQMIVALFPQLKAAWSLSDKDLALLSSVVPAVVSIAVLPVSILVDRWSRVGSIVGMGIVWSLSTIGGGSATNYGQLLATRAAMGLGEAGYGPAGTVLLSAHFPKRLHGRVFSLMYVGASIGSVVGVLAGGIIAELWSWRAALTCAGVASLVASLGFLAVRDFKSVPVARGKSASAALRRVVAIFVVPTAVFGIVANTAQLFVIGAMIVWLPSFFTRAYDFDTATAAAASAAIVLASSLAAVLWATIADLAAARAARSRPLVPAVLVVVSAGLLALAFGFAPHGLGQIALICLGALFMTATYGTLNVMVLDVVHPATRATSQGMLSLFQNIFGLAAGPFVVGALSDRWGLEVALAIVPAFSVVASVACVAGARTYVRDSLVQPQDLDEAQGRTKGALA